MQNGKLCSVEGRKITQLIPCCHQSLFVKTEVHQEYLYNTMYHIAADYEALLRMHLDGRKFQYIKKPIANYKAGGFSETNTTRWYIEVLTLLINNNISMDDIMQSPAYHLITHASEIKKLKNQLYSLQEKYSTEVEKTTHHSSVIQENYTSLEKSLSELIAISIWKHPIKKFQAYKKLLSRYFQQKQP
jgi:hypothetical protein